MLGGSIPGDGGLLQAELGFSGLRVSYHHPLAVGMSVGGRVGLDYAAWRPERAFAPALTLSAPLRYALALDRRFSLGLAAEAGLRFATEGPERVGLLLNAGVNLLFTLEERFLVGGGLDLPLALELRAAGTGQPSGASAMLPILVGAVVELHLAPPVAVTFEVKVGPHLDTHAGTAFGLKALSGIAIRL